MKEMQEAAERKYEERRSGVHIEEVVDDDDLIGEEEMDRRFQREMDEQNAKEFQEHAARKAAGKLIKEAPEAPANSLLKLNAKEKV